MNVFVMFFKCFNYNSNTYEFMPTIIYYLERFFQRQVMNIFYNLNSASMDQRLVKENVRPLQIIKGTCHVKKNRTVCMFKKTNPECGT